MKELYEAIEAKIKASGYPRAISGEDVYNDICDQIDGKENGSYVLLSKFEDDVIFEYHITIQDEDFNLGSCYLLILLFLSASGAGFLIQYRHILMQQEWQIVMEAKETLYLNQFLPRFCCYSSH